VAELAYLLRSLRTNACVLCVGAHPDDEESGLLAMLVHGLGARAFYWSATRGEGGQSRIAPYTGRELGVYRTWESLAARDFDDAVSLFGPFYDYGFSKSGAETLAKWGAEKLVRELVRAIRLVCPQVVISRWRGDASDGHGHHVAVGIAVREAFDAAADAERFADLGLEPWQPLKLYRSMTRDWTPGETIELGMLRPDLEQTGGVRINTGGFDPIAGSTFQQLGALALNQHLTQGTTSVPRPGDHFLYLRLDAVAPGRGLETSRELFDGIDTTLEPELERLAEAAADGFQVAAPWRIAPLLLEFVAKCPPGSRQRADAEEAAARCLGLRLEAGVDRATITPGETVRVTARLLSYGPEQPASVRFEPRISVPGAVIEEISDGEFDVTVPADAALSSPYWLCGAPAAYAYTWPANAACEAFGAGLIEVNCEVVIGGHTLRLAQPARHPETFTGGYRELDPAIVPPVSVQPLGGPHVLRARDIDQTIELDVGLRAHAGAVTGTLSVTTPDAWTAQPPKLPVSLGDVGEVGTLRLSVTVPAGAPPGRYTLRYGLDCGGRVYESSISAVMQTAVGLDGARDEGTCSRRQYIVDPAVVEVSVVDVAVHEGHRYGYVAGTGDELPKILRDIGIDVEVVDDDQLAHASLDSFDTIVIGPNAFLVRDGARRAAGRLLAYARSGGTLLVQYQGYVHQDVGAAPFEFSYRQPHDRVTLESSPVTILAPEHFVMRFPNRISFSDFEGWVRDRGLYFFGSWSREYQPLLASADPGEEPKNGGLLYARYGRGAYIYCGYSLFRQLAAGVPGAFRLFTNLLAAPEGRIRSRMEQLRTVSVFAELDEAQLRRVATVALERRVGDGEVICEEGEEGAELYVIESGLLEVLQGGRLVHTSERGELIGELAAFTGLRRTASLRSRGETELLVLRSQDFLRLLREDGDIAEQMLGLLARRLHAAMATHSAAALAEE
jgi:LmbE family N-acetylglucosaminyl deacetylase